MDTLTVLEKNVLFSGIGPDEIENLLKAAEIILFFLKKSSPPLSNSKKRQK